MATDSFYFGIRFREIKEVTPDLFGDSTLVVIPAAPALAAIPEDIGRDGQVTSGSYLDALQRADFAIYDSFFFKLLLLSFEFKYVTKFSGVRFLSGLIAMLAPGENISIFTIDPSETSAAKNLEWLRHKLPDATLHSYVAPLYGKGDINDQRLLREINVQDPDYVLINLGGGTQERLGLFVRDAATCSNLKGIVCSGAAIAFETGEQVKISATVDALGLGWLARVISKPSTYAARYLSAFKLLRIYLKLRRTR